MPKRTRLPRTEIIEYKQLKAAAGGSGASGGGGTSYKSGQSVKCRIVAKEACGYEVWIIKDNLHAFLQSGANLKVGQDILSVFVCVQNRRIILYPLLSWQA
jgi:hypothetical protein